MLTGLSIRDVVLIEALDLEIGPGFTALTGETGAGKSILLDALGLALGERGDKGLVRNGAERASASATFLIPTPHPVRDVLDELGMDALDDDVLTLRRIVAADGKSRAFVNDAPVAAKTLSLLGEHLLEVHGQHAAAGLMQPSNHRTLLDDFCQNTPERQAVSTAWATLARARQDLTDLTERREQAARDRDYITHILSELERLDPRAGEEETLDGERRFLMATEKLANALQEAMAALGDGGSSAVEGKLMSAARALERGNRLIADSPDEALTKAVTGAAAALDRALVEAAEARALLETAARAFDAEPGRVEKVEERLFALRAAARKHNIGVEALPDLRKKLLNDLIALENLDAAINTAEKALTAAEAAYDKAATILTASRSAGAARLDSAIMAELGPLKLDKARFQTALERDDTRANANGRDRVSFEIATNPGNPFGPLSSIASGGELARFSLALKVALASEASTATLVFDEVDQGVGGATADAVGRRLKVLSQSAQILTVTHSPQVAARADAHWRIAKSDRADGTTRTSVTILETNEREEEIARMLSGAEITLEARAAARILVGMAP